LEEQAHPLTPAVVPVRSSKVVSALSSSQ
jgi:hypothetical protein